jgi:hypothetical protein
LPGKAVDVRKDRVAEHLADNDREGAWRGRTARDPDGVARTGRTFGERDDETGFTDPHLRRRSKDDGSYVISVAWNAAERPTPMRPPIRAAPSMLERAKASVRGLAAFEQEASATADVCCRDEKPQERRIDGAKALHRSRSWRVRL